MTPSDPADIHAVATPALLVDVEAFEHNVATMAAVRPGPSLRPHVKAFKSTALAHELAVAGHTTFCCATVREMAGMAGAGLGEDLLLANETVDVRRLQALTTGHEGRFTVAVDSAETIEAAARGGVGEVLVDVNVGMPRCGCHPDDAGRLADLARSHGLTVRGVMGYEGHLMMGADRPVLALDHRGHGRSTKTHDVASYTVAQLTEDFVAFLEATASEPVDLLGHSMGGRIALMTALERPDLVHSLVLMDTSAWSFLPEDGDVRALFVEFIERFDPGRGLPDLTSRAGPEEALIAAATPPAWQARKAELSAAFDPHAFKGLGLQIFADHLPSARSRLAELTLPVSVLVGEHDHPFADQAPDLAREAGDRPLHVIPGAYHSPQLTHPDAWRTAVTDHLAEADAG